MRLYQFTFQYVSINTNAARYASQLGYAFTFQYVSINTGLVFAMFFLILNLHSNMFLLIRAAANNNKIGYCHLHSNMFLLIL